MSNRPEYTLLVTGSGELWINAVQDFIMPTDEPMFTLRGAFKKNEECKELQKTDPDGSWIAHTLSADSMVRLTFKTPLKNGQYPVTPTRLGDVMLFLERHDHVKVDIKLHACKRDPEAPEKFVISVEEASCLAVPVLEGPLTITHPNNAQSHASLGWQAKTKIARWRSSEASFPSRSSRSAPTCRSSPAFSLTPRPMSSRLGFQACT
jgi:hypothetical protein